MKNFQDLILVYQKIKLFFVPSITHTKYFPQIFDCWVNIIKKVKDSVLWIKSEDEKAKDISN